ncbi:MAG TPA: hypothetical protein VK672_05350, partial [Solirubrobacteraceae bacterium]|nr:hypothetical protein [Solirubrobacteraceae bacterium]
RDAGLLGKAALGFSGGIEGPGHSFDRGDREREELLREALAELGEEQPELQLALLSRLLLELSFDASARGAEERRQRMEEARKLATELPDQSKSLEFLLRQLESLGPKTTPPGDRLHEADNLIRLAHETGDFDTELKARVLRTFALWEGTDTSAAAEEIARSRRLADEQLPNVGALWRVRVMERAMMLFAGRFDEVERALDEDARGIETKLDPLVAKRRSMHQRVVFALDAGDPAALVEPVEQLVQQLKSEELTWLEIEEAELDQLAFQWWPTWRANQALVLAAAGRHGPAGDVLESLGRNDFEDILPHEYWLQAIAVIGMAVARNYAENPMRAKAERLFALLRPYAERAIVPGSVVMNWGSVSTVLGMLAAQLENWEEAASLLRAGIEQSELMKSPPAVIRSQLELALLHQRRSQRETDGAVHRDRAADLAEQVRDRAGQLGMTPVKERAREILVWAQNVD